MAEVCLAMSRCQTSPVVGSVTVSSVVVYWTDPVASGAAGHRLHSYAPVSGLFDPPPPDELDEENDTPALLADDAYEPDEDVDEQLAGGGTQRLVWVLHQ